MGVRVLMASLADLEKMVCKDLGALQDLKVINLKLYKLIHVIEDHVVEFISEENM